MNDDKERQFAEMRALALLGCMFGLYPQLREDVAKSIKSVEAKGIQVEPVKKKRAAKKKARKSK